MIVIIVIYRRDAPQFNGSSSNSSPIPVANNHQLNQQQHVTARPIGNGLYGYERSVQSPVNNFCRFPPSLVDSPSSYDWDEAHDLALDQQVRAIFLTAEYNIYYYCFVISLSLLFLLYYSKYIESHDPTAVVVGIDISTSFDGFKFPKLL